MLRVFTTIARHFQGCAFRQGLVDFLYHVADLVSHADGTGVTHAGNHDTHVRFTAADTHAIDFSKAILDGRYLRQTHDFLAAALDHHLFEVGRRLDATYQAYAFLIHRAAHLAYRRVGILVTQGIDHIADGHIVLTQLFSAQQDRQLAFQRTAHIHQRYAIDGAETV